MTSLLRKGWSKVSSAGTKVYNSFWGDFGESEPGVFGAWHVTLFTCYLLPHAKVGIMSLSEGVIEAYPMRSIAMEDERWGIVQTPMEPLCHFSYSKWNPHVHAWYSNQLTMVYPFGVAGCRCCYGGVIRF